MKQSYSSSLALPAMLLPQQARAAVSLLCDKMSDCEPT